jgi:hypothetical protein
MENLNCFGRTIGDYLYHVKRNEDGNIIMWTQEEALTFLVSNIAASETACLTAAPNFVSPV